MIKYVLASFTLIGFASVCHSVPVKTNTDFVKVKDTLWQQISSAGFNDRTTVGELDAKVSPYMTTNHASRRAMTYLEEVGIPTETLKSFEWHRYIRLHNSCRKAPGSSSAVSNAQTVAHDRPGMGQGRATSGDEVQRARSKLRFRRRKVLQQEVKAIDLSTLTKRIIDANLGEETDPDAFLRREKDLNEVWSTKKFTRLLAEYMSTNKGISGYQEMVRKARNNKRKRERYALAGDVGRAARRAKRKPQASRRRTALQRPLQKDRATSAAATSSTAKPIGSKRGRPEKIYDASDEDGEWVLEHDGAKQEGYKEVKTLPRSRSTRQSLADQVGEAMNESAMIQSHHAEINISSLPEWPSSAKKRRRQQRTLTRFELVAAPSSSGTESQSVEESTETQRRPTTAGKTYKGGVAATERPTVAKKTFTGAGRNSFPKAASITLRLPKQQQQQQSRSPSPHFRST